MFLMLNIILPNIVLGQGFCPPAKALSFLVDTSGCISYTQTKIFSQISAKSKMAPARLISGGT